MKKWRKTLSYMLKSMPRYFNGFTIEDVDLLKRYFKILDNEFYIVSVVIDDSICLYGVRGSTEMFGIGFTKLGKNETLDPEKVLVLGYADPHHDTAIFLSQVRKYYSNMK